LTRDFCLISLMILNSVCPTGNMAKWLVAFLQHRMPYGQYDEVVGCLFTILYALRAIIQRSCYGIVKKTQPQN
jgi:hypothetical protein